MCDRCEECPANCFSDPTDPAFDKTNGFAGALITESSVVAFGLGTLAWLTNGTAKAASDAIKGLRKSRFFIKTLPIKVASIL
jgi:hypothetical protein